ncbi:hypothetical protein AL00_12670 [Sphingobium indicum F2]|uniref:Uncharacterized protein n=1 Tax=Sphingobium indicum F2 TaxID=1450518 RepID=A0A8E0WRJ4_9SPHN|nr:hypothetical protein AL00_12670 [Sphingobium indicum F2]
MPRASSPASSRRSRSTPRRPFARSRRIARNPPTSGPASATWISAPPGRRRAAKAATTSRSSWTTRSSRLPFMRPCPKPRPLANTPSFGPASRGRRRPAQPSGALGRQLGKGRGARYSWLVAITPHTKVKLVDRTDSSDASSMSSPATR